MPREILIELLQQEPKLASETRRLESILRDRCGREKARINALVVAQREGVVSQLQGLPSGTPLESLLARLTRQIQKNVGLEEDLARWAVESWALALGVIRQPLVVAPPPPSPPVRTKIRPTVIQSAIESPPVRPQQTPQQVQQQPPKRVQSQRLRGFMRLIVIVMLFITSFIFSTTMNFFGGAAMLVIGLFVVNLILFPDS
jgi:hypothetical protein